MLRSGRSAWLALLVLWLASAPASPVRAQGVSPVPLEGFERGAAKSAAGARAAWSGGAAAAPAPRLVVALLFDQFRDDYLDRFRPVFGRDGFVRLIDGGARFRDCTIPYAVTVTGPGHATWLSGTTPAVHGIVANEWFDRVEGRRLSAAGDPSAASVGLPEGVAGNPASPRWMRAQTVADVLRGATHGAGRVVSISDKESAAILPAGRRPNGAYWLDEESGRMQTSSYYASRLPDWVVAANERRRVALEAARREPWLRSMPDAAYGSTTIVDAADTFPHAVAQRGANDGAASDVHESLHPVTLTTLFDFAEAAIDHEELGADATPDLLVLSVSITDYVGHRFGPDSPEVLDLAHRVDARLAEFLRHLDRVVGRGRWAVSLTADHGAVMSGPVMGDFAAAPGDSIGGFAGAKLGSWIDRVLARALAPRGAGLTRWARSLTSGLVTFDDSVLVAAGVTRVAAARVVADSAAANPWLAAGFTADDLAAGRVAGTLDRREALGFYAGRSGDVVLVPRPNVYFGWSQTTRSSHGTPYRYDTHVPFVMYGWGVKRGVYRLPVSTVDIAPTVSALLGIDAPAQSEGRVLAEGLDIPAPGAGH